MGVFIVCYKECNLNQYDILKVKGKRYIHNRNFSYLAPEIVTAVNYIHFKFLSQPTQCCWHNAAHLLPARLAKSNFPAGSSFKCALYLLSPIYYPHSWP